MERIKAELKKLKEKEQYRNIPNIITKTDGKIIIDGKEYINLASNDYLGLSTKVDLRSEFLKDNTHLMSSASARLLSGSSIEFKELERILAGIFNKDACLIFNTGYQCNLGVISALCEKGDVVFSDKLNHASIIDGMRLSCGDFIRYKHLDYNGLEKILHEKRKNYNRAIIVSESIFSMDGDIADIDRLADLKKRYNCLLMLDEAHAFCAAGKELNGISSDKDADIITATFGKALGSFGAFCVANNDIIDYLVNRARSFIFSTSIPPINIAWTLWLLTEKKDFLLNQKKKLERLVKQAELVFERNNCTHILPVITGSNENTMKISEKLKSAGFYIPAIRPPTVKEGTSRLRLSLSADIKADDLKRVHDLIYK